ncbi:MAG: DNA-directed RNA polymerase subunit K [Thaumarchaeota archaeon]|nr:DNA-directed RNA polymerase subunit K [Nitrososphaerota archaeon]
MAKLEEKETEVENKEESAEEAAIGKSLNDAISAYRKIREGKRELTEKELSDLDKECQIIENREIIEIDPVHEPVEIKLSGKGKIQLGPPTLTRFEKARIMGARALQLSMGAPPFIEIPASAKMSLDIAMVELEKRAIPIIIRRRLPNGDYQNLPIDFFD